MGGPRPVRRKPRPADERFTVGYIDRCVIVDHHRLASLPHVLSLAVGLKHVEGRLRRMLSVTAFVDEKPEAQDLSPEHHIPARTAVLVPSGGGTYRRRLLPTDVVVIEDAKLDGFNVAMDPVRPGAGIGGRPGDFGTVGSYVEDAETGQPFLLTCAHVVFPDGPVTQPGGFAEPPPGALVGAVQRWQRTPFDAPQWMDVAVADLQPPRGFRAEPTLCNEARVTAVAPASSIKVGMVVSKCGAATEGTRGTVTHTKVFPLPQGKLYGVIVIRGNPRRVRPRRFRGRVA